MFIMIIIMIIVHAFYMYKTVLKRPSKGRNAGGT